jgi:hypothetical protein
VIQEAPDVVEMFVADDLETVVGGLGSSSESRKLLRVAPPRKATPTALVSQKPEQESLQTTPGGEVRALKAELGVSAAELREASSELKISRRNLRFLALLLTLLQILSLAS